MKIIATLLLCAALTAQSRAQTAGDNLPLVLGVGCGPLKGMLCRAVVPRIGARSERMGVVTRAMPTANVTEAADAVCDGKLAAAIVPRDAVPRTCGDRAEIVGRPLFPYYAILLVKAGEPFRHLDDLAEGKTHPVLAAPGDPALLDLLRVNPMLRDHLDIADGAGEDGLREVASGAASALLTLTSLENTLIGFSGHGFTLIDIHPPGAFLALADASGHCLYRAVALDFGGGTPVTTISTDAVLLVGHGVRNAHAKGGPPAGDALAAAIEDVRVPILADTHSPPDWRPVAAACHDPGSVPRN